MLKIITKHPIALDSADHTDPHGALDQRGNEGVEFFYELSRKYPEVKSVLDLGTGTGAFVANGIADDFEAYGIEGSDCVDSSLPWVYYKDTRLFHADLRHRFVLGEQRERWIDEPYGPTEYRTYPKQFDLITAWDVMEHLDENTIEVSLENFVRHTRKGSYVMATIVFDNTDNEKYHTLCKPRCWWTSLFASYGFENLGFDSIILQARQSPKQNCFLFRRI